MDENEVARFAGFKNIRVAGGFTLQCNLLGNLRGDEGFESRAAGREADEALGNGSRQMGAGQKR